MTVVKVLDGPSAKYLPATGMMLVQGPVDALVKGLTSVRRSPEQQEDALTFAHEVVHHMQVLSSAYLWQDAVARVDMAIDLLLPKVAADRGDAAREIVRRNRAWQIRGFGVSVADLCEGTAVLESYRARAAQPTVSSFLKWRDVAFPGKGNSVYRRTFDIMADERGPETAFDLLPVISFLALQGDIPGLSFERLLRNDGLRSPSLIGASAAEVCEHLEFPLPSVARFSTAEISRMARRLQHPTLFPVLLQTLEQLGDRTLDVFARPHRALRPPIDEAVLPPMIIGAHRLGAGVIAAFGAAQTNKELRLALGLYTAMVGAAERLVAKDDAFVPCPHAACPNHEAQTCAGWVVPPAEPALCGFRAEVRAASRKELHDIAGECQSLASDAELVRLRESSDLVELFPAGRPLLDDAGDPRDTCAERFDERHLLDPDDNDGALNLTCPTCSAFWQEWATQRKMERGFIARCPNCGADQEIQTDRVFTLRL